MKILWLIPVLLCTGMNSIRSQDPTDVLRKAYAKCQSVREGYYEMTKYMKYMSGKDTSSASFKCYFRKLDGDSLFSSAFHYQQYWKGNYVGDVLYTGLELITTAVKDSTAIVEYAATNGPDIKNIRHNFEFYSPLTSSRSVPLLSEEDLADTTNTINLIGEENLKGIPCYHILIKEKIEVDSEELMVPIRAEDHFWISKNDFLPIQFAQAVDVAVNRDTMHQYELKVLDHYEVDLLQDAQMLTLGSIPSFYKITDYVPYKSPPPLPVDTIAPDWQLTSLQGESVRLSDLKGQVVLLDFFYKACYPCMLALPSMQALHDQYKDRGLRVIGIDPFDKKEDDLDGFLAKRDVTYTVLLADPETIASYRVHAYPTIYLLDKEGKILFNQLGYGPDLEGELETLILKKL